jgi:hypothetical protein
MTTPNALSGEPQMIRDASRRTEQQSGRDICGHVSTEDQP